jgi:hypothetical protein
MLFWYWVIFILALAFGDTRILYLSFIFMGLRTIQGMAMRVISKNRIFAVDIVMGIFFDLFGTFYLLYSINNPFVTWRGIKYKVKKGGYIENAVVEEPALEEEEV